MDAEVRSTARLLTDALHGMTQLLRGELALVKAETEDKARHAAAGAMLFLLAASLFVVGLNVLAGAAVTALVAEGMAPGWSALIVAGGFIFVAGSMAFIGRKTLFSVHLFPRRSAKNIRRDAEAVRKAFTHET